MSVAIVCCSATYMAGYVLPDLHALLKAGRGKSTTCLALSGWLPVKVYETEALCGTYVPCMWAEICLNGEQRQVSSCILV